MDTMGEMSSVMSNDSCDLNATAALHSRWIYESFGDCVVNIRQYFAFAVGLLSLVCWIFAQFPQIVVNCKTGTADKSLSFWFLLLWVFSDSANFLGAILTNQLITQVIVAAYFVFIDLVTLSQFCLHFVRNQGLKGIKKRLCTSKCEYGSVNMVAVMVLLPSVFSLYCVSRNRPWQDNAVSSGHKGRTLLAVEDKIIDIHDTEFIIGYALGWISAVIYFFALPPQIIKNFMRCSVSGVSLLMFTFVTMGDSTYLISVLLFSVDKAFIIKTLPWILGSAWSVIFDVFLVIQIIAYKYIEHRRSRKLNILSKETTV